MKYLLVVLGVPACMGMAWYVYEDSTARTQLAAKKKTEKSIAVHVTRMQTRDMRETVELAGRIEPKAQATLRARVAGYIAELPVDLGDPVTKGKSVVKLDDTRMKQAVETARAAVNVAEAQVAIAEKERIPAARTLRKYKSALQNGAITRQEVDDAASQLEILETRKTLAEKNLSSAQTELNAQREALKETEIISRFAGVVAQRFVEVGDLANPNDPLIRIVNLRTVHLQVNVVEANYGKVRIGQTAEVRVDAHRGETFIGKVVRKAPELDRETRTALVKIEIDNADGKLKPGMTSRAEIIVRDRPNASVLPVAALLERQQKRMVFVAEGDPLRAQPRDVTVGVSDDEFVEIRGGVKPGERVISLGNRLVTPGQLVEPEDDPAVPAGGKAGNSEKPPAREAGG